MSARWPPNERGDGEPGRREPAAPARRESSRLDQIPRCHPSLSGRLPSVPGIPAEPRSIRIATHSARQRIVARFRLFQSCWSSRKHTGARSLSEASRHLSPLRTFPGCPSLCALQRSRLFWPICIRLIADHPASEKGLGRRAVRLTGTEPFEEVAVPQFENQKLPQDPGVIAPLPKMLFEQLPHGGRPEIAALEGPRLDEYAQFILQLVSHPVHEGQGEAALGLLFQAGRRADRKSTRLNSSH